MLMKPGWRGCFAVGKGVGSPSRLESVSIWEEEAEGETLRSRAEKEDWRGEVGGLEPICAEPLPFVLFELGGASLKMWTVSVALLTQRRVLVALKLMQYIRAGILPRRNW